MSVIKKYNNIGFSEINYEKVKKYKINESKNNTKLTIYALVAVITVIIALVISDYRVLIIPLSMSFLAIINIVNSKSKSEKEYWDGVITNKKIETKVNYNNQGYSKEEIYLLEVKKENGKIIKFTFNDREDIYNYYKIGDIVRHHKGFDLFEKYNKKNNNYILCLACLKMNSKKIDNCRKCNCKLFK
ncbi:MAG: hypothetical protein ACLFPS_04410 [Clostridia bacterium]